MSPGIWGILWAGLSTLSHLPPPSVSAHCPSLLPFSFISPVSREMGCYTPSSVQPAYCSPRVPWDSVLGCVVCRSGS